MSLPGFVKEGNEVLLESLDDQSGDVYIIILPQYVIVESCHEECVTFRCKAEDGTSFHLNLGITSFGKKWTAYGIV